MKNKYVRRARIDEKKFKEILRYFAHDMQANQIALLTGLSRNSINSYLKAIRHSILSKYTHYDRYAIGSVTPQLFVLQILQNGVTVDPLPTHINTEIMKYLRDQSETLLTNVLGRHYSAVIDYSEKRLYCLHEEEPELQKQIVNSFWHYTRLRLMKFRGLSPQTTLMHIKECEFRFNHREKNLYRMVLTHFRKNPLKL